MRGYTADVGPTLNQHWINVCFCWDVTPSGLGRCHTVQCNRSPVNGVMTPVMTLLPSGYMDYVRIASLQFGAFLVRLLLRNDCIIIT